MLYVDLSLNITYNELTNLWKIIVLYRAFICMYYESSSPFLMVLLILFGIIPNVLKDHFREYFMAKFTRPAPINIDPPLKRVTLEYAIVYWLAP